ncbi:MAG: hypothetical protein GVY25_16105 [Bacteroidetes bacterium]|nr:hypothetical protein [Bacteroidota bacterium]
MAKDTNWQGRQKGGPASLQQDDNLRRQTSRVGGDGHVVHRYGRYGAVATSRNAAIDAPRAVGGDGERSGVDAPILPRRFG